MNLLTSLTNRNTKISVTWLFLMSELTSQYFQQFQHKIVVEMSHTIVPLTSEDQISQALQQLQLAAHRTNPFKSPKKVTSKSRRLHKDILHAVIKLPGRSCMIHYTSHITWVYIAGMTEKKSRSLLEKFHSLQKISVGSQQEISGVIGPNLARGLENFFNSNLTK